MTKESLYECAAASSAGAVKIVLRLGGFIGIECVIHQRQCVGHFASFASLGRFANSGAYLPVLYRLVITVGKHPVQNGAWLRALRGIRHVSLALGLTLNGPAKDFTNFNLHSSLRNGF